MARPKKPEAERLSRTFAWRVTEADGQEFDRQFAESGLTQAEFFRELLQRRTVQIVARPRPSVDAGRVVYLFNKAGNNLNQIAHGLNTALQSGRVSESTAEAALATLELIAEELRRGLADAR